MTHNCIHRRNRIGQARGGEVVCPSPRLVIPPSTFYPATLYIGTWFFFIPPSSVALLSAPPRTREHARPNKHHPCQSRWWTRVAVVFTNLYTEDWRLRLHNHGRIRGANQSCRNSLPVLSFWYFTPGTNLGRQFVAEAGRWLRTMKREVR
jgi:hypothetical protein